MSDISEIEPPITLDEMLQKESEKQSVKEKEIIDLINSNLPEIVKVFNHTLSNLSLPSIYNSNINFHYFDKHNYLNIRHYNDCNQLLHISQAKPYSRISAHLQFTFEKENANFTHKMIDSILLTKLVNYYSKYGYKFIMEKSSVDLLNNKLLRQSTLTINVFCTICCTKDEI